MHQLAPLALPYCLGLSYWHNQSVLSWYLHQPELHQLSQEKVLDGVRDTKTTRSDPMCMGLTTRRVGKRGLGDNSRGADAKQGGSNFAFTSNICTYEKSGASAVMCAGGKPQRVKTISTARH